MTLSLAASSIGIIAHMFAYHILSPHTPYLFCGLVEILNISVLVKADDTVNAPFKYGNIFSLLSLYILYLLYQAFTCLIQFFA